MDKPVLGMEEQQLADQLDKNIRAAVKRSDNLLPFDQFMEMALYEPGLGYYVNGRRKFGVGGDFVTAPEISPLFSRCMAVQCAQVLAEVEQGDVLEIGAGSGRMATDILLQLEAMQALPERYLILEVSPDLQLSQKETLQADAPHLLEKVEWLQTLPDAGFKGVVVANELMDAMPVHRFSWHEGEVQELFVSAQEDGLVLKWADVRSQQLNNEVLSLVERYRVEDGYESEINLRLKPWFDALAERLEQAAIILIDYGYSGAEYYLPERDKGTLICHFRHRAHADALMYPGMQDITANVDFTAAAQAAFDNGFEIQGFTTQAHFLIDTGLDRFVAESDPTDIRVHTELVQEIKKLTMPGEMGERFKVLGVSKGLDVSLMGFSSRNLVDRL